MSNYIETPSKVKNPGWTKRNQKIASHIPPLSNVLDLGCGAKDLLKYISPATYIGIDYNDTHADMRCNFNEHFTLPQYNWDYIVISGVIEYLFDIDSFFNTVKNNSKYYIITIWQNYNQLNNPYHLASVNDYKHKIQSHFEIVKVDYWKLHDILICKDIK
jgi:hypothetical protein